MSYSTTGGSTVTQILVSGTDVDTVDFGFVIPASIGDLVWHDLDADGVRDAGEPPFAGVEVTATGPDLPAGGLTRTTDANGHYLFSNLSAGTFTIAVALDTGDLPAGYDSSTGGATATVTVADDAIIDTVDFGFYTQASIGDFVFDDLNGNGSFDAGEPGIEGLTVTLDDGGTAVTTTTGTGATAGEYDFTGLEPGTYTVTVDTAGFPAGTVTTLDGAAPSVTVASTDDVDTADFGYLFPATFGDFVFHDLNGNGSFDAGEPGIDGVDVTLTERGARCAGHDHDVRWRRLPVLRSRAGYVHGHPRHGDASDGLCTVDGPEHDHAGDRLRRELPRRRFRCQHDRRHRRLHLPRPRRRRQLGQR